MGYKYDDKAIKCPLFKRVVRTTHGKFMAIVCTECKVNLGFELDPCLRFRYYDDLRDYTAIFCKDRYKDCPFYKYHSAE